MATDLSSEPCRSALCFSTPIYSNKVETRSVFTLYIVVHISYSQLVLLSKDNKLVAYARMSPSIR